MEPSEQPTPVNPWEALIDLPLDTPHFQANGLMYFVIRNPKKLSIDRYIEFERKSIELGFSGDFPFLVRKISFAMKNCNPTDFNIAFTTLHNLLRGMTDDESKVTPCLLFCTLFIAREGSDITRYNTVEAREDILNWSKSIGIGFFLTFANDMLGAYNEIYQAIFQYSSQVPPDPIAEAERKRSLSTSMPDTPYNDSLTS